MKIRKIFSAVFVCIFTACAFSAALQHGVFAAQLPEKYECGVVTPVLDQKNNPLCWAYSGSDLFSISAVRNGYAQNGATVFSAPMIARAEYDGNEHRHSRGNVWYKCYGGLDYALYAGITGKGMMFYSDYPTIEDASHAPVSALYDSTAYIESVREYDTYDVPLKERTVQLKKFIYEFGAVSASAFIGDYNSVTHVARILTYDNTKASHAVLLVGWDDTKYTDTGTGAFLMKNTWGEKWGDGGYAWVSYNSDFGRTFYAASVVIDPDTTVLSHTEVCSLSGNSAREKDGPYGAVNVFTANEKMIVTKAGIYAGHTSAEGEISIWKDAEDVRSVLTKAPDAKASVSMPDKGYYTVSLDKKIELEPGDTLTVLYTVRSGGVYHVYSEYSDPDFEMCVSNSEPGQSYTLSGGELISPKGNYLGTVIGKTEHKDPPVTETDKVTEAVTETDTETEKVTETLTDRVIESAETEDTEICTEEQTHISSTDTDVQVIGTDGTENAPGTDTAADMSGTGTELPDEKNGSFSIGKVLLIIAAAAVGIVILFILLILALIAASKKKKV